MYRGRIKKIHFIGIGGSGMSGIAEVLINMGYSVSGSDLSITETTKRLAALGADIKIGHLSENINEADCVVYSSAVSMDNPEIEEANSRQIPIIGRAEMLAELMRIKYGVLVAGTHGKTSTTSMIASILEKAGFDPTFVIGGKINASGTNAKLGKGEYIVAEADESDGSFLKLSPTLAVVTNIDREHMDHYKDMDDVKRAYVNFMNKVPFYGCSVVCIDHPVIQGLLPEIKKRTLTFGLTKQADIYAEDIEYSELSSSFTLFCGERSLGRVTINSPGRYNVYNALAAAAAAWEMEVDFNSIKEGLLDFKGVARRFEVKGVYNDIMIVDDYGHHPVEIKAVLRAVRDGWQRRSVVVFQPHRYSRTKDLFNEFLSAFNDAEKLIITEVYPAGEKTIEGYGGEDLYKAIRERGHKDIAFIPDMDSIPDYLTEVAKPGDMVITLGAGSIWKVGEELAGRLSGGTKSAEEA
jgi:UDP-N-acetylmuramate--alanine ligase